MLWLRKKINKKSSQSFLKLCPDKRLWKTLDFFQTKKQKQKRMSHTNLMFSNDEMSFAIRRYHDFLVISDHGHYRLIPKSQIREISCKTPSLMIYLTGQDSILLKTKPNDVGKLFDNLINWFDE
jgi:hypothetical protein